MEPDMLPSETHARSVSADGGRRGATPSLRARLTALAALYRIALPIALWIVFVNVASHYRGVEAGTDAALHDAVVAELVSRRCPGLRLDPASFRDLAQGRGISHADLYQKRSAHLQKAVGRLERRLRADPEGECQRMFDLYDGSGPAPRLLTRT